MFKAGDKLVLSLWDVDAFTAEVGQAPGGGLAPLTLSHNLATTDGVDRVLEQARVGRRPARQRGRGARVGWLLRLLRRPRRLPLGDLLQPRTHRPGGAPVSDSTSDRVTYGDVAAAGLDDWRMLQLRHPRPVRGPAASPRACAWSTPSVPRPTRPTTTPTSR